MASEEVEQSDEGELPPGDAGPHVGEEESPEYLITIEYDNFLTRFDLDEILKSIDRIIEWELLDYYYDYLPLEFSARRRYRASLFGFGDFEPRFSYVGIESVGSGSIILKVVAGIAVLKYVVTRFKKGVDESLLVNELARSGRIAGDLLGALLGRINDWAERYVPTQRQLGGKITKITVGRSPSRRKRR